MSQPCLDEKVQTICAESSTNSLWYLTRNKALVTLFSVNGIFNFAANLLGPLYAVYVEGVAGGIMAISYSVGAFQFSATLFKLVMMRYGDRIREREYLLMGGYLIRAICYVSYIFVDNLGVLIAIQAFKGIGAAMGTPGFNALTAEHLDIEHDVSEYSLWSAITNVTAGVSAIVGGLIVTLLGFPTLFVLMTVLTMISFFVVFLKPRDYF